MRLRRIGLTLLVLALLLAPGVAPAAHDGPGIRGCVVLLHGLARKPASMRKLARALSDAGYLVQNHGYKSRRGTVANLAAEVIPTAMSRCDTVRDVPVHFVTHSMGGILLRQYLAHEKPDGLGRAVMLSPPNHGSELVDKLGLVPGFRLINGPAGRELGTGQRGLPGKLGAANFEVGVIAGNRSLNPFYSLLIPGKDDGKVSVEHARLEGMSDFLVVPHSHTFIMKSDHVIEQVRHFLAAGRFEVGRNRTETL